MQGSSYQRLLQKRKTNSPLKNTKDNSNLQSRTIEFPSRKSRAGRVPFLIENKSTVREMDLHGDDNILSKISLLKTCLRDDLRAQPTIILSEPLVTSIHAVLVWCFNQSLESLGFILIIWNSAHLPKY